MSGKNRYFSSLLLLCGHANHYDDDKHLKCYIPSTASHIYHMTSMCSPHLAQWFFNDTN